ncbi:hypothetical protein B0H19DRAFT_1248889 [Mycena capillaripes]|nr:hypothetical protein B0H19DRAFT_1248889 [Mycena capillaripes]
MLLQLSEDSAQVFSLVDEDATQAEIFQAFETHLINNSRIQQGDPIVIYFAGKGRRLEARANGMERDVDVLLPHDCDDKTWGISDFAMHALLCDLAQKKGSNITFILDTSFSSFVPRGQIGHRSDISQPPPADAYISWRADSTGSGFRGFYSSDRTPCYVLLAAGREGQLAGESHEGGAFTQALAIEIQRKQNQTYRELCAAFEFESETQNPICSGSHIDQLLFSIAPDLRIPKLRVFVDSPTVTLETHEKNDFVQVWQKSNANISLSSNADGGTIIERLDGLVAAYASRKLAGPAQDPQSLSLMLNRIARFNYYLCLKPPHLPSFSLWKQMSHWLWDSRRTDIELYHLTSEDPGMVEVDQKQGNLLRRGVAHLNRAVMAADGTYGMKIINCSNRKLYPRLFYFDPGSYSITVRLVSFTLVDQISCLSSP